MSKRSRDEEEPSPISSSDLLSIVTEIHDYDGSQKDKQRIYRKKFPEFAEQYPVLFEMATREQFNIERFKYMLKMRDSVADNRISQYDASAKVGTDLYNEYVKPNIKN